MIKVLIILWGSALLGYLLRRWPQKWVEPLLTLVIWIMLALIGTEVGSNRPLILSIGQLGLESLTAAAVTAAFCCTGGWLLWKMTGRNKRMTLPDNRSVQGSLWKNLKGSLIILCCFTGGCFIGLSGYSSGIPEHASLYALYLLLLCVGFSIGQNKELLKSLKNAPRRMMLLPLFTIVFTLAGSVLTTVIVGRHSLTEWMSVGSGFGYYSLSSILITEVKGAELGTIALMYNILLEITTLVTAPIAARYFGPLAPISLGGATTVDTTLPTISKVCGSAFVPISIFHGIVTDFSVTLLVPFFCSI